MTPHLGPGEYMVWERIRDFGILSTCESTLIYSIVIFAASHEAYHVILSALHPWLFKNFILETLFIY